ncbi:putative leucine-rich repeat domain, L domain-containing protein [Lupinus albus]|uniref:Putative leucine-rich repeat domain, L domain-containing protein n=1 Tax=Lupinus albus TaxID=3870 RepID=A0A6A4Q8K5_LUPAL|nr:putative leucine-rich repeat domain, L domain-containing protein [Lupinus albus]
MAQSKSTPSPSIFIDLTIDDNNNNNNNNNNNPSPPHSISDPFSPRLRNILSHFYKDRSPTDFEFSNFQRRYRPPPTLDFFSSSSSIYRNHSSPSKRIRITQHQELREDEIEDFSLSFQSQRDNLDEFGGDPRGKRKLGHSDSSEEVDDDDDDDGGSGSGGGGGDYYYGTDGVRRFSREEKEEAPLVEVDFLSQNFQVDEVAAEESDSTDSNNDVQLRNIVRRRDYEQREIDERRNRFREVAKENASKIAQFQPTPDVDNDKVEMEFFDSSTPFSKAMKIIEEREMKKKSLTSLWVPRKSQQVARFSIPLTLLEMCLQTLVKHSDAIVSLDGIPDFLRHKISQLLCDSRKMNIHYFELLVNGSPTEIRLRDCSWLLEDQFTKFCQTCDTSNLKVLQLDQCGRCVPDYALPVTLAESPSWLPRLTSLSLSGACRLSDKGLHVLVSYAPALRSINLSQCSLLTLASVQSLAGSLGSLLKELYLDDCQNMDAAKIVPALKKLVHLEILSLAGIQSVSDEFIKDYIVACGYNMKELVLKDCIKLTNASAKVIAEHCPVLCALDLMNLSKLTDVSIGYLTNSCRTLHTLKLCRNAFSDEAIAAFMDIRGGTMRELSLNNIRKVGHHTTLSLASRGKNLHSLDLSWCRNLHDNELGLIVDSCFSVRLLKLFGCTQVTDVFLKGHSNPEVQIIGLKMSPLLQHVKMSGLLEGALRYSPDPLDLM